MTTRDTLEGYFAGLKKKQGWETYLADPMTFTSYTSPIRKVSGRAAYLVATKGFYSSIVSFEIRDLLVLEDKACALTRNQLQGPAGPFTSDVAEIFQVRAGQITSFEIYFDSAPFPK